uniref:TNF receptor-associated factor 5-like isoform X1 n=1 Tax=Styela clava TaxID=7725 RepID=UPI00193AC928|nr:TNF receptor-associated factor 5-like isoform X1 [Styela clava]
MILQLKVLHMYVTPSMPFESTGPLIEIKTAGERSLLTGPTFVLCFLLLCWVTRMEPSGSNRITQATNNNDMPSTSSGPPSDEFQQFKGTTEYQIMILQRMVQEVRNSSRVGKEQIETMSKEFDALKTQLKTTETRLAQLQKVVAVQTDNNTKLKRETTEKDNAIKTKVDGFTRDINDLKASVQTITQNLAELERNRGSSTGGGSSSANIPENLTQMLEALERQLGMYDVRIAEMDLRFQVLETTSYNGCLVWRIRDYERRKEDAKRGRTLSLYSQPFYTSRYGYKMCTRIYLNGDGMGHFDAAGSGPRSTTFVRYFSSGPFVVFVQASNIGHEHRIRMSIVCLSHSGRQQHLREGGHHFSSHRGGYRGLGEFLALMGRLHRAVSAGFTHYFSNRQNWLFTEFHLAGEFSLQRRALEWGSARKSRIQMRRLSAFQILLAFLYMDHTILWQGS